MDILKIIQQHGESLTSLANKLGVTQPTLSNNIKRPSYQTLERIAAALDVEPWQLLAPPAVVEELKQARAQERGQGVRLVCPHCGKTLHVDLSKDGE